MANAVLGGGITGLSAAHYLSKLVPDSSIKLYESTHRLGGWIKTNKTKNGTIFEQGPRTLRCRGAAAENTFELVKQLDLTSSVRPILSSSNAAKNRMLCLDNQLVKLPNSWTALFKVNPPFMKPFIHAILKDLSTPKKMNVEDESIYDFVARRFGKQYADIPLSAMVCGIFAGDAKEISVKALLNDLFEKEQQYGSVIGGYFKDRLIGARTKRTDETIVKNKELKGWSLWSLENGLEMLPSQLGNLLKKQKNVEINVNSECTNITFANGEVLLTINGKIQFAKHLYSCLPSKSLAKILDKKLLFLKEELSMIPFVNVATVNLEYNGNVLRKNEGFGFLVPPNQNLPILGIIFDSCIFAQNGRTVLTVMMGGKWFEEYFGSSPNEGKLLEIAQNQVKKILKITEDPSNFLVTIMTECIPQYIVGHSDRVKRIRSYISEHKLPLTLMGNSFDGIGVNDAIFSAKTNVQSALEMQKKTSFKRE